MVFAKLLACICLAFFAIELAFAQFQPIAGVPCYEPLLQNDGKKLCPTELPLTPQNQTATGTNGTQELCCDASWLNCKDNAQNCVKLMGYCGLMQWSQLMKEQCKKSCGLCYSTGFPAGK